MLRTIRKYRRSVLGLVAIGLVALAMSGFGVNLINKAPKENYAIKVNDRLISFDELTNERRNIEERYRQVFGKNYKDMLRTFNINPTQQAIDKKIADALLEQAASKAGFYAGDNAVARVLQSEVFPQGFDAKEYNMFLNRIGMSAKEFEDSIRNHTLRSQLVNLLSDASFASKRETRESLERQETRYSVDYVEFLPSAYLTQVAAPSDAEVESWYNDHSDDYKLPARVAYEYAVLDPKDFASKVEVTADDIEIYYTDHQTEYVTPEEIKVRHIQFTFPKAADENAKAEIKKKADEALRMIKEGQAFDGVAKMYSDDTASAPNGGDLGWAKKGKLPKSTEEAAFKLLEGENSDIVSTDNGYEIVKVDERKPSRQKELSEVKNEIEAAIRLREAPAYTASYASDLLDTWSNKAEQKLSELASANNLKTAVTASALDKDTDPDPSLKGLTAQVLENSDQTKQLAEIGEKSVLVFVTETKPVEVAPLSTVKEKIVGTLKEKAAKEKAKSVAQKLVDDIASGSFASLKSAVEANSSLKLSQVKDITHAKPSGVFSDATLSSAVFNSNKEMEKPSQVYEAKDKFYVLQVTAITKPADQELQAELAKKQEQESRELGEDLVKSIIEKLKADAKIDIDPTVMNRE